jgi:hypothetical protein
MGCYSDPTASQAIGNINREFSGFVKKARRLRSLYEEGKISAEALESARSQFKGLYRNVLDDVLLGKYDQKKTPSV